MQLCSRNIVGQVTDALQLGKSQIEYAIEVRTQSTWPALGNGDCDIARSGSWAGSGMAAVKNSEAERVHVRFRTLLAGYMYYYLGKIQSATRILALLIRARLDAHLEDLLVRDSRCLIL